MAAAAAAAGQQQGSSSGNGHAIRVQSNLQEQQEQQHQVGNSAGQGTVTGSGTLQAAETTIFLIPVRGPGRKYGTSVSDGNSS